MANKRPPASDDRLHEIVHTAILTTDPKLTGKEWNLAVKDRACSILTLEDEIFEKLRTLDACYSANSDGKVYSGVIVAAYVDPKVAHRGFIRFLAPDPNNRNTLLEEEVRTVPLQNNAEGQHQFAKAVSLIGHRVLIAKNKDTSAPAKNRPWVLTHLEDYGKDTSKPNWAADWAQAQPLTRNNKSVKLPQNAHVLPGGTPPDGYGPAITDTTALNLQNLKVAPPTPLQVSENKPQPAARPHQETQAAPPTQPRPAAHTAVPEAPANAGEQQTLDMQVPTAPPAPPADQAFLHTPQQNTNPARPSIYTNTQAKKAIVAGAQQLGLESEPATNAAKEAWATSLGNPSGNITANQVEQAIAWIKVALSQRQPAAA